MYTSLRCFTLNQRRCCCTVKAARFVVVACTVTDPVRTFTNLGRTVRRQEPSSWVRFNSGCIVSKRSTPFLTPLPWFARSMLISTSVMTAWLPRLMMGFSPTLAPSLMRLESEGSRASAGC